jgi:heme/copper-type cytochrome/quinol oxidase subunit 4
MTFSGADAFLKFILTAVAIGYTTHKWYFMHLDRKNNKKNKDEKED